MKKNFLKTMMTSVLAISVLTGIAGCGDNAAEEKKSHDNKISVFWQNDKATPGEGDKKFVEVLNEKCNVDLQFETPPSANYADRLQLMLASGEYTDVIYFNDTTDKAYLDAIKNEIIIPINDYLTTAENLTNYTYDASWEALKANNDENIYGIPRTTTVRADGFLVRQDWLEKVGLSIPEDGLVTIEEFTEILRAFTKDDPDGNGKDDTYGLSASLSSDGTLSPFIVSPFGKNGWLESDGEYEYMNMMYNKNSSAYKKALEYSADVYKKGYIDPDAAVNKRDMAVMRFRQGIDGIIAEFAGNLQEYLEEMRKINPDVELTYIVGIKDENGKSEVCNDGTGMWGFYAITKNAKDPQKIVDMFDWLLSDEGWDMIKYGLDGITYNIENDKKIATEEYGNYSWAKNLVRRNNDPEYYISLTTPDELRPILEKNISRCVEQVVLSKSCGFKPQIASSTEYIEYQKTMSKEIAKIVVGEQPVDKYDEILNKWYQNGGEEYVKEMNAYITSRNNKQ